MVGRSDGYASGRFWRTTVSSFLVIATFTLVTLRPWGADELVVAGLSRLPLAGVGIVVWAVISSIARNACNRKHSGEQ